MRRHHFLALRMPEAQADSISLLIGAEANRERTRPSPRTPHEDMQRPQLPHVQTGNSGDTPPLETQQERRQDDAEPSPDFLGCVGSYARLMHMHTKSQLDSPAMGTIPTYAKTMHAHTLNQLTDHRRTSKSEASSPQPATRHAILPVKVDSEVADMASAGGPQPPLNTPDHPARKVEPVLLGIDFGKLRQRSLTTPYAARDFAAVESRDFAPSAVG